jgi:hypothetical protein
MNRFEVNSHVHGASHTVDEALKQKEEEVTA